jgi:hypothetical protein
VPKPPPPPPVLVELDAVPVDAPQAEPLPPAPGVAPLASALMMPPVSTVTLPATRKTTGLAPLMLTTCPPVTVSPCSRMTVTAGPPPVCVTPVMTSGVPSAQVVSVTTPVVELIVIVPAALQFHVGDVLNSAAQVDTFTFTDGGSSTDVHALHMPLTQVFPVAHA